MEEPEDEDPEDGDQDCEQKGLKRLIEQIRSTGKMSGILSLAQDQFVDEAFVDNLDSVSHLLGVRNGVVNLETGELRSRRPEDLISTIVAAEYDPTVDTTWVEGVVKAIMGDDDEMVAFLQRLLGYCITGDISEDVFVCFTNSGENLFYK